MEPTQADTEMMIFGAGAEVYSWWVKIAADFEHDADVHAPDGWTYRVWHMSADEEETVGPVVIDHETIMQAMRTIVDTMPLGYSTECFKNCARIVYAQTADDFDAVDFDAGTADEVLQVAVYGKVIFG